MEQLSQDEDAALLSETQYRSLISNPCISEGNRTIQKSKEKPLVKRKGTADTATPSG